MNTISLFITSILILVQPPLLIAAEIPPPLKALHVLNRLGFGPRPGDVERVNAMGVENYIHRQLFPESIAVPSKLTQEINELKTYSLNPSELYGQYGPVNTKTRKKLQIILREAIQARLMQAIESPRQLQEVMVEFWYNHFNVDSDKGAGRLWAGNYERQAIRPYALGRFRDLLEATAKHPAMLFYLDNWQNEAPGRLNENYARELMELHTLGVNGGYTNDDVVALMHILTGWGYHPDAITTHNFEFFFNDKRHDNSKQVFLRQTISPKGEQEVERVLDILAKSPATARHISFQLAQYFVSDDPDPVLVEKLTQKFEETNGDIRSMLQTIFESPQFWDEKNYGNKFKTPFQYIISEVRASGREVTNYIPLVEILRQLGMPLYECETPKGYDNTQKAWLNSDQMLKRVNFAMALALGSTDINNDRVPVSYEVLMSIFNDSLSDSTMQEVQKAPAALRAMLVLGSPDMMRK